MFEITAEAAKQIKVAADQAGTSGMALRLVARENKDGSFAYHMGFDEPADADLRMDFYGVQVIMDPAYEELLEETTLDFILLDGESEAQFVFLNPLDPSYIPPKKG